MFGAMGVGLIRPSVAFGLVLSCRIFLASSSPIPGVHVVLNYSEPRKLEHRFRMIHAGIPFCLL